MVTKIVSVLSIIIMSVCLYAFLQPSNFKISRSIIIASTPEIIFPYINNSAKANDWMPWKESDPNVQMVYTGPEEGLGSMSSWESTGKMGTGKAVVVESALNRSVKTQLTYTKPMVMSQLAEVSLEPEAEGTRVTWSVTGENSFMGRLMCLFLNMDKLVGDEFEKGLQNLKKTLEN